MLTLDNPVVGGNNTSHGSKENSITTHEGQESGGGVQNLPRYNNPATDDSRKHATSLDVNVFRAENRHIVGSGTRQVSVRFNTKFWLKKDSHAVSRDVSADLCNVPRQSRKEGRSATTVASLPVVDNVQGIPEILSIDDL